MAKALKTFTVDEVAKHNKDGDLWVTIDSKVYDLSRFAGLHPGGSGVLLMSSIAGKDATQAFFGLHRHEVLLRPQYARLQIGVIEGEEEVIKPLAADEVSKVPYAEPMWLSSGYHSPYFTDSHRKFQKAVRKFVSEVVAPEAVKCEENGKKISQEVVDRLCEKNILAMRLGKGKHLKGRTLMDGLITPEEFDHFHELIINFELARLGTRGFVDGLLAGGVIAIPPILNFGSPDVQTKFVPELLSGKKYACWPSLAFAGSDVSSIQTTAERDGDEWVINGTKNLTKAIKTAYSSTAGTAYVTFDNVRVPVSYTLGQVNAGMKVILSNFNHERWMMCCTSLSAQRKIVEDVGKPLNAQAVIRSKVEAAQNWLETEQSDKLAGPIGLLKQCYPNLWRAWGTQTGMGKLVENYHRTSPYDAILGGAEDVLGDLGVRQAMKKMPKNARL
ncbi:acyl-CoA dehydrogenase NM domain-like protein [Irpex lacteus]|nr:acyl-CoA dehydrogenase NM domain-like protein [Irpex lacteus]